MAASFFLKKTSLLLAESFPVKWECIFLRIFHSSWWKRIFSQTGAVFFYSELPWGLWEWGVAAPGGGFSGWCGWRGPICWGGEGLVPLVERNPLCSEAVFFYSVLLSSEWGPLVELQSFTGYRRLTLVFK